MKVPIEVSARHAHLNQADLEKLFGKNFSLSVEKKISQPNQFAAKEYIAIKNGDKLIDKVRIVGPIRTKTQVEISKSDARTLGTKAPIRLSGDIDDSQAITLIGPNGSVKIDAGLIVAKRHLHVSPAETAKMNIKNGQIVSVAVSGVRAIVFEEVIVRSREEVDKLAFHIDTDEANAANIEGNESGTILE